MKLVEYLMYIPFALAFAHAAYTDWARREISNRALLVMLACGMARLFLPGIAWKQYLLFFLLMTIFCVILYFKCKEKPGGGDVKLLPILTLYLGLYGLLADIAIALVLVGCASLRRDKAASYPLASYFFAAWLLCLPLL